MLKQQACRHVVERRKAARLAWNWRANLSMQTSRSGIGPRKRSLIHRESCPLSIPHDALRAELHQSLFSYQRQRRNTRKIVQEEFNRCLGKRPAPMTRANFTDMNKIVDCYFPIVHAELYLGNAPVIDFDCICKRSPVSVRPGNANQGRSLYDFSFFSNDRYQVTYEV